jgi:DNA-binding transcriptional ArsR family regulator
MPPAGDPRKSAPPAFGAHVTSLLHLNSGVEVLLDDSPAYDLVQGLASAMHGRANAHRHVGAALAREEYTAAQWERLRRWFGSSSPIGAAYMALVPLLSGAGEAEALPAAIERMPLGDFLRLALTAGAVNPDAPLATDNLVTLTTSPVAARTYLDTHLHVLGRQRALLLRVLAEPEVMRAELVELLRLHTKRLFAHLAPDLANQRAHAVERLRHLAKTRPSVIEGWMRVLANSAGFAPLVIAPVGSLGRGMSHYLHESRQPLFDSSTYEPLLVLIGVARVLAEEPVPAVVADPAESWASFFAALADPTRLRLLHLLAQRPYYGQELAPMLGVSEPTVSHHLSALHKAGIVLVERQAHRSYLVLQRAALANLLADGGHFLLDESAGEEGRS